MKKHKTRTAISVFLLCLLLLPPGDVSASPVDTEYLERLEKSAFAGFQKLFDPLTGFPVDGAPVAQGNVIRISRSVQFNKTSPVHLAYAFLYWVLSWERGFVTREEALMRAEELMDNLTALETYEGFLYQWYSLSGRPEEWPRVTLNRFISSHENGILDSALMITAGAFPQTSLSRDIDKYLERKNYQFFYSRNPDRPASGLLNQGFDVLRKKYAQQDLSILNSASRVTALIAILKDSVSESAWTDMERRVRDYETLEGRRVSVLSSWSGSLAEALWADEILGGDRIAPEAFRKNALAVIMVQRDKGKRLGTSGLWGFSSGEVPDQGRYEPMGVTEVANQRPAAAEFVTPYSVLLALRYAPGEAVSNLQAIQKLNPAVFGERYGFADSLDPVTGVVNRNILTVDKGAEMTALGNFMSRHQDGRELSHYLWAYFKRKGWEKRGLDLLKSEESHPAFRAIAEPSSENKEPMPSISHERMNVFGQLRDIGTFYEPDRSRAFYRWIEKEKGENAMIGLRYDVSRPFTYSGLYLKLRPADFSAYQSFRFRVRGSAERGYPQKLKVEIKNKGQNVQLNYISLKHDWQDVLIRLPRFLKEVDEVAFVFDNAETGKGRRGEIFLEALYFN